MRNLRIASIDETTIEANLPLAATAWDTNTGSIICAFGPTSTSPIIELKRRTQSNSSLTHNDGVRNSEFTSITSWDAPCPLPDLDHDEVLLTHYFPDTLTVCLVLAGGDLILVREEPTGDQEKIEIVGSVDVGIAAAAWAPDEELLAIVTRSDTLVLMSRDLEPVTETTMTADDLQVSKHVSVGWGKKETQFQGKRAKAMRDPTMPEHVDEGLPSPYEDGKSSISWRGDGAYLAINAVVPAQRRVIRVYSREGVLDSVSEPVDGLEAALSWRPAGNLIASIKRSNREGQIKTEVVFFERNGLRHGEFTLRLSSEQTEVVAQKITLAWNFDSTVLAVSLKDAVQYWTMGNYHYYLKQDIRLSEASGQGVVCAKWHPEKALKCYVHSQSSLVDLEFLSQMNRGSTIQPTDYGIAAVVDGAIVKLTPLRHAGVPPPMSFCEVETTSTIVDLAVSRNGQRLAVLTTSGVELCEWDMRSASKKDESAKLRHTTNVQKRKLMWSDIDEHSTSQTRFTQVCYLGNNDVYLLAPAHNASGSKCVHIRLLDELELPQAVEAKKFTTKKLDLAFQVRNMITDSHQDSLWAQDANITRFLRKTGDSTDSPMQDLAGAQVDSAIFRSNSSVAHGLTNGEATPYHKISLTGKGTLLADKRVLARDCTSFVLTDSHLIYTTAQHLLKFIHLSNPEQMEVPGDTPEVDERCRSIERGAKIVTVISSIYAVVLQMPRGNLETIYPRVLVVTGIRESLRNLEYRTAFLACQNHQVDMNIIYDYLPDVFIQNVQKFVEDLNKPSRVDEFLSKLKAEDVTQTLYKDTLNSSPEHSEPSTSIPNGVHHIAVKTPKLGHEKINSICDTFISILKNKPGNFLQCIITAHVCKRPPDLLAALKLVSSICQTSVEEADLAISHLCFLTDTNRLFDAALSLYDLELTLLVAQNAQRDPREYMPFLQNLQSLSSLRRQYQIDNHLRNYSKAMTSLHALEAHNEVKTYTIKHNLYTHAMDLYKYSPIQLSTITNHYAEHLASQSQHSSAATLYDSLGSYDQAYPLYALGHKWRESLACATLIPLPSDKLHELAHSLATTCAEESRDYRSAATIYLDYLSDPSTAAKLLCKGSYFADATRLLALHNLQPEIPITIDTGLTDKFSELLELVADCKSQLAAQVPRIQELRIKKAEDPLAFYGGDPSILAAAGIDTDIPDNISLAPTDATTAGGQSLFTRYGGTQGGKSRFAGTVASNVSRKTSKTKRKEERKRASGKKGSVYEEEYLVASVGRLIERVNGVHDEVDRLVGGLLRRGMRERALKVGEVMREIGEACEKAKGDVWGVDQPVSEQEEGNRNENLDGAGAGAGTAEVGQYRPSGANGVFWDSQQQGGTTQGVSRKEAPVVKTWKGDVLVMR